MKKLNLLLSVLVTFGFATLNLAQTFGNGVKDIDGNSYPTVIIGTQEWMASNLKTTHYSNGDVIDFIADPGVWSNCVNTKVGAWCHVNNNTLNDQNLGLFYNWYAATDSRNVCPNGWHISNESDWNKLTLFIDPNADTTLTNTGIISPIAGGKLKSTKSGTWGAPNIGATDEYGFNSKGTNFRGSGGNNYYWPLIRCAFYWVPLEYSSTGAWVRVLNYDDKNVTKLLISSGGDNKSMGNAVRCVSNLNIGCSNSLNLTPQINSINTGKTAIFTAATSIPNSIYTWQSDFGQGYVTLNDYGLYSGTNTSTLTISNVQLSNHNQPIRAIATSINCVDTSNIAIIHIADTCITNITVNDTVLTTVTDTLIINTTLSLPAPNNENTILIYPNPASDHITINNGNFAAMAGYSIKITNNAGQEVFINAINQAQFYVDLSTWKGNGLYFVHLIDQQKNTVTVRKIVLQ
jgi:uncharacterized protein (TIGR02145 family)